MNSNKIALQWRGNRPIPLMDKQIADFEGEEWKAIPGYDDYLLSNFGRVKSLKRFIDLKNGQGFYSEDKILSIDLVKVKNSISIKVSLIETNSKKSREFSLPRLIYGLFAGELEYKDLSKVVRRKDGDPLNCDYRNLVLLPRGKSRRQPVSRYNKEGLPQGRYDSKVDAAEAFGLKVSTIKEAITEKSLQGGENYWRTGEPVEKIDVTDKNVGKEKRLRAQYRRVQQIDILTGERGRIYESIVAAGKALNLKWITGIHKACGNKNLTAYGYKWRYMDAGPEITGGDDQSGDNDSMGNHTVTPYNRRVAMYNINGVNTRTYPSASMAAKENGTTGSAINGAIKKKKSTINESYWRSVEHGQEPPREIDVSGYGSQQDRYYNARKKAIEQYNKDGTLVAVHKSLNVAGNAVGVSGSVISRVCRRPSGLAFGYRWQFAGKAAE